VVEVAGGWSCGWAEGAAEREGGAFWMDWMQVAGRMVQLDLLQKDGLV
jgi:hypothetical protein